MIDLISTTVRTSWLVAGAAAIAIFAGGVQAGTPAPQITVRYAASTDTNLLYSRLQTASARVCRLHEGRELRNLAETHACYNEALGNAVAKIGNASLTSLHQAKTDMHLAQRDMNRQRRS
jgi:UrcA family protein